MSCSISNMVWAVSLRDIMETEVSTMTCRFESCCSRCCNRKVTSKYCSMLASMQYLREITQLVRVPPRGGDGRWFKSSSPNKWYISLMVKNAYMRPEERQMYLFRIPACPLEIEVRFLYIPQINKQS